MLSCKSCLLVFDVSTSHAELSISLLYPILHLSASPTEITRILHLHIPCRCRCEPELSCACAVSVCKQTSAYLSCATHTRIPSPDPPTPILPSQTCTRKPTQHITLACKTLTRMCDAHACLVLHSSTCNNNRLTNSHVYITKTIYDEDAESSSLALLTTTCVSITHDVAWQVGFESSIYHLSSFLSTSCLAYLINQ